MDIFFPDSGFTMIVNNDENADQDSSSYDKELRLFIYI